MSYDINRDILRLSFPVPTAVVDDHIRLANEHQLKVLLWILRNSPENPDIGKMCAALKMKPDDAADYLRYWVLTGVLSGGDCSVVSLPESAPSISPAPQKAPLPDTVTAPSKPSAAEILTRIEESPEIGKLFTEAQKILGRTIGYDGQCTMLLIHDHYGLPIEVIFTLIGYCVSVNKTNYGYIEAIGRDWGNKEIDTFEKAQAQVASLSKVNTFWKRFTAMAGITIPRPTISQTAYIRRWLEELKYGDDMIFLAYEEMANHTQKFSIGYINKVLVSWHEKGYKKPSDIENAKKSAPAAMATGKKAEASYDIGDFEKKSIGGLKYERNKKV